jgi:predicted kinase
MLLAADSGVSDTVRRRAEAEARRYLLLALSANRPALVSPVLVCVGGIIASGKSTIASALADRMGAPVVEADRTRKHLLGVAPSVRLEGRPWQGAYGPAMTDQVYAEVLRRGSVVLASGRPVVLDASFRSREMRQRARDLATACHVPFLFVECRVAPETARERLLRRESRSGVSDARLPLFDEFCARFEVAEELPGEEHLLLDTGRPLDQSLAALHEHVTTWPRGLVA